MNTGIDTKGQYVKRQHRHHILVCVDPGMKLLSYIAKFIIGARHQTFLGISPLNWHCYIKERLTSSVSKSGLQSLCKPL